MADFWKGFGQGFAPAFEGSYDRARSRREKREDREYAKKQRQDEIDRLAQIAKDKSVAETLAYGDAGVDLRGMPIVKKELGNWFEDQGELVFDEVTGMPRRSTRGALGALDDAGRMGVAAAAKLKHDKLLLEEKRGHEKGLGIIKRQQTLDDRRDQRAWDIYVKDLGWDRDDRIRNETLHTSADKEFLGSLGYELVLTGDSAPEWVRPGSVQDRWLQTGKLEAQKDLEKEGRDTQAARDALLEKFQIEAANVAARFGTQLEGLYYRTHKERMPDETKKLVLSSWTDARNERDRLFNLMDLQGQYRNIFETADDGSYLRPELTQKAKDLDYEYDLRSGILTNAPELTRAIDEIYGAFDDKQKAAATGADVPYKYTSGYDRNGQRTFRTWVLKDNVDPRLMMPSEQYLKTGEPTDSVADRWIQRANSGLRIEVLRFGDDQAKNIPIRVVTAMDFHSRYLRGKTTDISDESGAEVLQPKADAPGPEDKSPMPQPLPEEPLKLPPLPGDIGLPKGEAVPPDAEGIDIGGMGLPAAVEKAMMAKPEGVPFTNAKGQEVVRRGNKLFRVK